MVVVVFVPSSGTIQFSRYNNRVNSPPTTAASLEFYVLALQVRIAL